MRDINRCDSDDEDDPNLVMGMRHSRMQQQFKRDRDMLRRRSSNYEGGSCSGVPRMNRSFTVREGGQQRGRDRMYEPVSTPASRLRAVEIDLEKNEKVKRQRKINTSGLNRQKKKVLKAFGNWIIDNNQPFAAVNSAFTNPLMNVIRETSVDVRAPSAYELAEVYLPEECRLMNEYIGTFAKVWDERGVTIMSDGWTGTTRMHILNYLVYSPCGTIFHKSVDVTNVSSRNV
ncbi:hypothetical protein BVRB_018770, partial [Beta vulgaris subsp. vulgaris]